MSPHFQALFYLCPRKLESNLEGAVLLRLSLKRREAWGEEELGMNHKIKSHLWGTLRGGVMNVRCRLGVSKSCDRVVVTVIDEPGFFWGGTVDRESPGWSVSFPSLLLELTSNIMALKQNRCNSGSQKSEGDFCEHQKSGFQQGWLHSGHHRPESFVASSWLWTALYFCMVALSLQN